MFFERKAKKALRLTLDKMRVVTAEDDRVYRNQIAEYASEHAPCSVSVLGLYKARLFGCGFPLYAYVVSQQDEELAMQMANLATGLAISDTPSLSREVAGDVSIDFLKNQIKFLNQELDAGPSELARVTDGCAGLEDMHLTDGFIGLVDMYHGCLVDSIGQKNYTGDLRHRLEFMVRTGIFIRLEMMGKLLKRIR